MREPGAGDEQAEPYAVSGSGPGRSRREVQQAYRKAHRHPRRRRGTIALGGGLALLLVVVGMASLKLNSNINELDVSKLIGKRPAHVVDPASDLAPMNILVMGSDTRTGLGTNAFGTSKDRVGAASDTTLIVHLSGDRKSAVVVSVPRDSMTRAPRDCKDPTGLVADGPLRQWNANFALGGPACLIRTVEGNTNIPIDHFVVLNFVGFESMVDALGKVEVCVPTAVHDSWSGLKLPAGRSRVSGAQALSFVRIRKNIGKDGSDLGRINRQQAFLSAMVQEATSSKLLLRPDRLFRFLDAATHSLTKDPELSLNAMREVAQSVVGMNASQIRFVTVPTEAYPPNPMRVQWTSDADALWNSIRYDTPLPGSKTAPKPIPKVTATPAPVLTIRPDRITVQIRNASGVIGLARQAADDLHLQGFVIAGTSTSTSSTKGVTVGYSSLYVQRARTVAAAFPGATLVKDENAGSIIRVTLGSGSPNVVAVPNRLGSTPLPSHTSTTSSTPSPSPSVTIKARTADSDICAKSPA